MHIVQATQINITAHCIENIKNDEEHALLFIEYVYYFCLYLTCDVSHALTVPDQILTIRITMI